MIDAETQDDVVELPNGLLNVIGNLEALQLHGREPLLQLTPARPGRVGRPGD